MALKAGRVGVHPNDVLPDGHIKAIMASTATLPISVMNADSGTLNGYVNVGLAYRAIKNGTPFVTIMDDVTEVKATILSIMYAQPETVDAINGRIVYKGYRGSAEQTLVIDTTTDTDNGHLSTWQWL